MTRIVAGTAKGRMLKVPAQGTRPTSERVREALFSRIDHLGYLNDVAVLDLYAGSGALGLEAKSRGALYVELVDSSAKAAKLIRENAKTCGFDVVVAPMKAQSWVAQVPNRAFDVVFIDPPYAVTDDDLAGVLEGLVPHVAPDALIVIERSSRSPEPIWPQGWEIDDTRTFGDTCLWFAFAGTLKP